MSIGLRDTLIDVLVYTSAGTTAGRVQDAWTVAASRWARLEAPSGAKTYLNGSEQQRIDAVACFGDDATDITQKSLLRITGQTAVWKVLAVLPPRRRLREVHVLLAQADKAQYPGLP